MKKSVGTRILSLVILAVMLICATSIGGGQTGSFVGALAAGFEHDPNLNEPGAFPVCKEQINVKIGIQQHANVSDYVDNKYTKMLEEKANVAFAFEIYPSDAPQKIELMIAAGGKDLPELLIAPSGLTERAIANYGENGFFLPLNDYIANSSYYISSQLERTADKKLLSLFTSPNGNVYHIPSYAESISNEYNRRLYLYKPWLDQLGLDIPTTTEEFKTVLEMMKATDLNGNGKHDEIPLMGATTGVFSYYFDFLMNSFVMSNETIDWMVLKDGEISFAYTTEEWKQGIKYMRDLCVDDLLTPISFTQDDTQAKQIITNAETLVGTVILNSLSVLASDDPRRGEYVVALPLIGPEGVQQSVYVPTLPGAHKGIITQNAENPEAIFRILDIMWSEEATIWSRWGEPEVDWRVPVNGEVGQYEAVMGYPPRIVPILVWGSVQNAHWNNCAPCFRTYEIAAGMTLSGNALSDFMGEQSVMSDVAQMALAPKEQIFKIVYTGEESDIISEIQSNLNTYVKEKNAEYITGATDIDADWDKFQKELQKIGLETFRQISQTAFDRQNQ